MRPDAADYELPLFRGRWLIPPDGRGTVTLRLGHVDEQAMSLRDFRVVCQTLVRMSPDRLEAELLRACAERKLFMPYEDHDYHRHPGLVALRRDLAESRSSRRSAALLVALARSRQPRWAAYEALFVLDEVGREGALAELDRLSQWRVPRGSPSFDGIRDTIRSRIGLPRSRREATPEDEIPTAARIPTTNATDLAMLELDVTLGDGSERTMAALDTLTRVAPGRAARALARWRPTRRLATAASGLAVWMASWFGHHLRVDRGRLLRVLTEARDPYIRAAGAVYLAMDDPVAGGAALRSMDDLPGHPGTWVALARARRGDRAGRVHVALPGQTSRAGGPFLLRIRG